MQKRWMMCISVCVGTRITHAYVYICVCVYVHHHGVLLPSLRPFTPNLLYMDGMRAIAICIREKEREEWKKCRYMNGMCSTFDTGNLREELYVRNAYFTNRDSSSSHTHAQFAHAKE